MKGRSGWQLVDFILTKITGWYVIIAELAALIIMLLSVADVIGAKFFNNGIPSATELVEQLNVPLVFGAVAFVTLERGHIRIDSLDSRMSETVKYILKIFSRVLEILVCGFLSWRSFLLVQDMVENFYRNSGTWTFPLAPFAAAVMIGFILLTIASMLCLGREITANQGVKKA